VTVAAVAVAAISAAVAAYGVALEAVRTTALVVVAPVTSTQHAQHQSRNREAPTVFYKMLRTH
jgi:hypothetical protein